MYSLILYSIRLILGVVFTIFICFKLSVHFYNINTFFFEETKLPYQNCYQRESNLRLLRGAHFKVISQDHRANPSKLYKYNIYYSFSLTYFYFLHSKDPQSLKKYTQLHDFNCTKTLIKSQAQKHLEKFYNAYLQIS